MTRRTILVIAGALALLVAGCDWTTARYGPGRTGSNDTEVTLSAENVAGLTARWSAGTAYVTQPPVVANGIVYATTVEDPDASGSPTSVEARRAGDGSLVWTRQLGTDLSGPTVAGGLVVVGVSGGGQDPRVVALRADTGDDVWQHGTVARSMPTVSAGAVYVASSIGIGPTPLSSDLRRLDLTTGSVVWSRVITGAARTTTVGGGRVYVATSGPEQIQAYRASDGTLLHARATQTPALSYRDGALYFTLDGAGVGSRDAATGAKRWSNTGRGRGFADDIAVSTDRVYSCTWLVSELGVWAHVVVAYDRDDGTEVWRTKADCTTIVHANGVLYTTGFNDVLRLIDASTGTQIGTVALGARPTTAPIVANGSVYVGVHDFTAGTSHLVRLALP